MMTKQNQLRLFLASYIGLMWYFSNPFSFMSLNVFLAWLPLEFGYFFVKSKKRGVKVGFFAFWLLFFPNIPYLLTDLLHLKVLTIYRPHGLFKLIPIEWWYFLLLVFPVIALVILGLKQVFMIISQLEVDKGWQQWLLLIVIAFLSSLAIYIGRFERVHSIELFLHPLQTFGLLVGNWSIAKVQFVSLFTLVQAMLFKLLEFEGGIGVNGNSFDHTTRL